MVDVVLGRILSFDISLLSITILSVVLALALINLLKISLWSTFLFLPSSHTVSVSFFFL